MNREQLRQHLIDAAAGKRPLQMSAPVQGMKVLPVAALAHLKRVRVAKPVRGLVIPPC